MQLRNYEVKGYGLIDCCSLSQLTSGPAALKMRHQELWGQLRCRGQETFLNGQFENPFASGVNFVLGDGFRVM